MRFLKPICAKQQSNEKIIYNNVLISTIVKGGALVITVLTTPAFITYFRNNEVLGVWYTLLSVLVWFLNFDLGVGNGIRNNLVIAIANKDQHEAKCIISSGIAVNLLVTVLLSVVCFSALSFMDLSAVLNVKADIVSPQALNTASVIVLLAIMTRLALNTITSIFYAIQKSAVNSIISLMISITQLLFVMLFRFETTDEALVALSIGYLFTSNVPVMVAGAILFHTKLKSYKPNIKYVDKKHGQAVLSIGSIYFVCQILYMLIVNTNEFLVSNVFGPIYATEYTFYYKVTSTLSIIVTLAMTPVWSVVTKAVAEKNYLWLQRLLKKVEIAGGIVIVIQYILATGMQVVMDLWLGSDSIIVSTTTSIAFASFSSVFVYSSMLSTLVCGMSRMKLQTICYSIGVVGKFAFVYIMAKMGYGWTTVVWSNVIVLLPYCIAQQLALKRYVDRMCKIGIP